MNYRNYNLLDTALFAVVVVLAVLLAGCANLDNKEQRMVSGAAIGGTLACWPGALVGTGIGYLVGESE